MTFDEKKQILADLSDTYEIDILTVDGYDNALIGYVTAGRKQVV